MGWRRACSAHPETVSCCHGGDCELRRSRYAGLSWPPRPGQRAVPRAGSQAPGCEGRAWRVAGEAVTVDDRQLMLISAAVTCPLDPQPTTGRLTPSRCFANMSPPLHPLCPTSAQATIISPLFHLFLPLSSQRCHSCWAAPDSYRKHWQQPQEGMAVRLASFPLPGQTQKYSSLYRLLKGLNSLHQGQVAQSGRERF